ncbi:MAG: hypothetical protein JWR17_1996 [Pseudomonas sp.]|nr:DUF1427 family protein [Pseudomonas sp.]MDB6049250.1 hypothetical protein [Pseudomonas sp.]
MALAPPPDLSDIAVPAPHAIALVGLMGMLLGEKLWPMGKRLVSHWLT